MSVTRKRWSTRQRAAFFRDLGGVCHLCGGKIDGVREAWDLSHDLPLELGGADDESNILLAHRKCHRAHTATVDIPTIAKAKRREAKHHGFKAPKRPIRSAGFPLAAPQSSATRKLSKWVGPSLRGRE